MPVGEVGSVVNPSVASHLADLHAKLDASRANSAKRFAQFEVNDQMARSTSSPDSLRETLARIKLSVADAASSAPQPHVSAAKVKNTMLS